MTGTRLTVGLYLVDDNLKIERMRRGRAHFDGNVHLTPAVQSHAPWRPSLCGGLAASGRAWEWTDDDIDCEECLALMADKLETGALVIATNRQVRAYRRSAHREWPTRAGERDYEDLSPEWTL